MDFFYVGKGVGGGCSLLACNIDGTQLVKLSITLPGDEIWMHKKHTATIWFSADTSPCVCVFVCV